MGGGYPGPGYQGQPPYPAQAVAGWRPVAPHGNSALWTVLSIVPILAVPVGLFISERGSTFWSGNEAWSVFAVVCAFVQLAPLLRSTFGWSPPLAWRIGAAGVGGLLLFWVLLVLPSIGRNTSFAVTIGVAAACAALWMAPARQL
jgi:hypothetical protein